MLNHDLLFSVPCCFLLDRLIKEAICNVMADHLQSSVTLWRQYASHVKVHDGTLLRMDVHPARMARQLIKTEPQHHLAVCHCTVAQAFSVPLVFLFVKQLKNYLMPHIKIWKVSWDL